MAKLRAFGSVVLEVCSPDEQRQHHGPLVRDDCPKTLARPTASETLEVGPYSLFEQARHVIPLAGKM